MYPVADDAPLSLTPERAPTLAALSVAVARYSRDLRFVFVNSLFEQYTGLKPEQVIGKTLREAGFPEEGIAGWEEALRRVFATGEPVRLDVTYRRVPEADPRLFERVITPEWDASGNGEIVSVLAFSRDVTENRWATRRERFLADLTERLGTLTDPEAVLDEAARAVCAFAGVGRCWYGTIAEETGTVIVPPAFVSDSHAAGATPFLDFGAVVLAELRAGNVVACEDSATESRLTVEQRVTFQSLGLRSFLCAPLHKEGLWGGVLVLQHTEPRRWSPQDEALLSTVAERTWLVAEHARLFRESRLRAERASFLSEASRLLGSTLEYRDTLTNIARLIVPRFADWCAVDLTDATGMPQRVAVEHVDPEKAAWGWELHRRYPPSREEEGRGLIHVLRNGESSFVPGITDEMLAGAARDDEHLRLLREIGLTAVMMVPLLARGSVFGALSFVATRESGRLFTHEDLHMAQEVGRRAALAIENARLFQAVQEAEAKQRRIAETLQLSLLLTPPASAFPGLEVGTHYEAAWDEALIGGDFYEVVPLDGGRIGLIVGDGTGKGLEAARYTAEALYSLRNSLRELPDPAAALSRLNRVLLDGQRLDQRPENALAAVAVAVIDTQSGETWVASGGAEPPLLLRARSTIAEEVLVSGALLGADADASYTVVRLQLAPGDFIALFTDGVTEARNRKTRQFFGYDGLTRALGEVVVQSEADGDEERFRDATPPTLLDEMARGLIEQAKVFAQGRLTDDACVLLARLGPFSGTEDQRRSNIVAITAPSGER